MCFDWNGHDILNALYESADLPGAPGTALRCDAIAYPLGLAPNTSIAESESRTPVEKEQLLRPLRPGFLRLVSYLGRMSPRRALHPGALLLDTLQRQCGFPPRAVREPAFGSRHLERLYQRCFARAFAPGKGQLCLVSQYRAKAMVASADVAVAEFVAAPAARLHQRRSNLLRVELRVLAGSRLPAAQSRGLHGTMEFCRLGVRPTLILRRRPSSRYCAPNYRLGIGPLHGSSVRKGVHVRGLLRRLRIGPLFANRQFGRGQGL